MQENKFLKGSGSGWFEKADVITNKAPIHQRIAQKKEFEKDFGNRNISISPSGMKSLHFDIDEKSFGEFAELTLKFAKENNDI